MLTPLCRHSSPSRSLPGERALSVYTFFNCRESDAVISPTWLLQQLMMQLIVFLRQSGTSDALIEIAQRYAQLKF